MNKREKFLEDLNALLEKYDVEIYCEDTFQGYTYECYPDPRITIEFNDYEIKDIEFGVYINKDNIKEYF